MIKNTKEFIFKAKQIHGNKYDYIKASYEGCYKKVCIICPEHGEFWQLPNSHLKGQGCPKCGINKIKNKLNSKYTKDDFIKKAREIHGNKYDYSKVKYVNKKTEVCIICPEHGEFWQLPYVHLRGANCPKCFKESKKLTTAEFINKAKQIHGDKYDYSKVEYINSYTKVCIICPEHGEFWITPNNHISTHNKCGCPECKKNTLSKIKIKHIDDFIKESNTVHNNKYLYEKTDYKGTEKPVIITCPIHGDFEQRPQDHIRGHGCPKCSNQQSLAEDEIYEYLVSYLGEENVVRRCNNVLDNKMEIDIFVPKLSVGIEFNGLKWHSEEFGKDKTYHIFKTENALSKGINLIQIFEDEWNYNKKLVLNKIGHILKISKKLPKIMARKCVVREINKNDAKLFLNKNHIQGFVSSTIYLGAYYNEQLIGVISFVKEKENVWNLTRLATDINYMCCGVCGKLLEHFKRNYKWATIKTFADRRWTNNMFENIYIKLGFSLSNILKPDYRYVFNKQRIHKFNFRKQTLSKKYGFSLSMTESEMTKNIKAYKIWDCGLFKYILKNDNN